MSAGAVQPAQRSRLTPRRQRCSGLAVVAAWSAWYRVPKRVRAAQATQAGAASLSVARLLAPTTAVINWVFDPITVPRYEARPACARRACATAAT